MAGSGIVRIELSHLKRTAGIADEAYESAADALMQALKKDHACIVQLDEAEVGLIRDGLAYAITSFGQQKWSKGLKRQREPESDSDGGYHSTPGKELYNALLGDRCHEPILVESFKTMSQASHSILAALAWGLRVHTTSFEALLDNEPLHPGTTSASVLSCFNYKGRSGKREQVEGIQSACPEHVDKGLVTMIASDEPGLEVLSQNAWKLVPAKLLDNEIILLSGQALFEATGGQIEAARHRVTHDEGQARFSLAFKCRPQLQAVFDRGPIADANPTVARKYRKTERLLPVATYMADFDASHASVNKAESEEEFSVAAVQETTDVSTSDPSSQEDEDEGPILVTVKDPWLTPTLFKCHPRLQVQRLRDVWLARCIPTGTPDRDRLKLVYGGRYMEAGRTLKDYNIQEGSKLLAIFPLRSD